LLKEPVEIGKTSCQHAFCTDASPLIRMMY
jgi:hypothetical protein